MKNIYYRKKLFIFTGCLCLIAGIIGCTKKYPHITLGESDKASSRSSTVSYNSEIESSSKVLAEESEAATVSVVSSEAINTSINKSTSIAISKTESGTASSATVSNTVYTSKLQGNSNTNIANGARLVKQGEWLYYISGSSSLYKSKIDGSEKIRLTTNSVFSNLNILGDWVYYYNGSSDIQRIRTDGSKIETIVDGGAYSKFIIFDQWLYYLSYYDENDQITGKSSLYRVKIDGTAKKLLLPNQALSISIYDNCIYYHYNVSELSVNQIRKMNLDGTQNIKISDNYVSDIVVVDGYIYGKKNNQLSRIKIDGTDFKIICPSNDVRQYIITNDLIYFTQTSIDKKTYKIKTDGSNQRVFLSEFCAGLHVFDDYIFYYNVNYKLCKISQDLEDYTIIASGVSVY